MINNKLEKNTEWWWNQQKKIEQKLSNLEKKIFNTEKWENTSTKNKIKEIQELEKKEQKELEKNIETLFLSKNEKIEKTNIQKEKINQNSQEQNNQTIIPEIISLNRPEAAAGIQKSYSNIENTIKNSTEDPNPIARFFGKIIKRINP